MTLTDLPRRVELTCYRVKLLRRAAHHVDGTPLILLPDTAGKTLIIWREAVVGGKRSCLRRAVAGASWVRRIPNALIKE
jgi:hypothetical protein